MSGRVIINGVEFSGNNVSVTSDGVVIDGVTIEVIDLKKLTVVVEGSIDTLKTDKSVDVKGNGTIKNIDCGGSVSCDTVHGDVNCGGSVSCDDIGGNVQCGGSISCDTIHGNVKKR